MLGSDRNNFEVAIPEGADVNVTFDCGLVCSGSHISFLVECNIATTNRR